MYGHQKRRKCLDSLRPNNWGNRQALHRSATERLTDRVLLIVMPRGRHHGEEPPAPVSNLMKQQQIVIVLQNIHTHKSGSHSSQDGARKTMSGMTDEMFNSGGMTADFNEIKKTSVNSLGSYVERNGYTKIPTGILNSKYCGKIGI